MRGWPTKWDDFLPPTLAERLRTYVKRLPDALHTLPIDVRDRRAMHAPKAIAQLRALRPNAPVLAEAILSVRRLYLPWRQGREESFMFAATPFGEYEVRSFKDKHRAVYGDGNYGQLHTSLRAAQLDCEQHYQKLKRSLP